MKKPRLLSTLVLCGPSGTFKTKLMKKVVADFQDVFSLSVSHTSRNPQKGEVDGRDHHFVSRSDMEKGIQNEAFIVCSEISGHFYGTSEDVVKEIQDKGKVCILDLDVEGVKQIKLTKLDPIYVFVKPESLEDLETRLWSASSTKSEDSSEHVSEIPQSEIEYAETPGNFDLLLEADQFEVTYLTLRYFLLPDIAAIRENNFRLSRAYQNGGGEPLLPFWHALWCCVLGTKLKSDEKN